MDERELDIIKYNVIGGAERQRASGLILTQLQTAAPLVARLIEENAAQAAEIDRLRSVGLNAACGEVSKEGELELSQLRAQSIHEYAEAVAREFSLSSEGRKVFEAQSIEIARIVDRAHQVALLWEDDLTD